MGMYTAIDEHLEDGSSRFYGKPFGDDALSSLDFVDKQPGPEITLNYSIENGLESQKKKSGTNPRRRLRFYFIVGSIVIIGTIFVIAMSVSAPKKKKINLKRPSVSAANSIHDDRADSRFSTGQEEGGGVTNSGFQTQNDAIAFRSGDTAIPPFSLLDPVADLGRYGYDRPRSSSPSTRLDPLMDHKKGALPTNAWYQNMLRLDEDQDPTKDHRVYTVPYILDAAGTYPGLRAHATRLDATPSQVTLQVDEPYALTLGAMVDVKKGDTVTAFDKGYSVHEATELGLTLHWSSYMKSTLVRGSPYVTMIYNMEDSAITSGLLPTMRWGLDTSGLPVIDGVRTVDCQSQPVFAVERDLELTFHNSGQRWLIFFSRPVKLQCQDEQGNPTFFQVLKVEDDYEDPLLIIRAAVVVSSSSADDDEDFGDKYANQLRANADTYPGQSTAVTLSFNEQSDRTKISFNWDPHSMHRNIDNDVDQMISRNGGSGNEMIMFALPHHQEILAGTVLTNLCTTSLLGPVCLAKGNVWNMYEDLPVVDFQAPRHPDPKYVPVLAEALVEDIRYRIPDNFRSGAGDTYFSGKTIARLARILLIAEELKDLCATSFPGGINSDYADACDGVELPNDVAVEEALEQLRETVTVWIKTNKQAPFVYDKAWGGLISCGCLYSGGECTNQFPDCPAFADQGLNFGNGFYNDHHFHYGYHVYAAAVLAHYDTDWAIEHYEDIALFIRDYANPSAEDESFPTFRNKDWFRGHSWASGLTEPMFGNIMNQESTSEAIAAYESVALFGKVMTSIFQDAGDTDKVSVAKMMHNIGLALTATEIRSAQKYWQVRQNVVDSEKRFPRLYTARVVGILWETFVQFTTWFGNAPYLIYGIQLLPLTPISESRDGLKWAEEIYAPLAESCNEACVSEGWSIQVNAILATIGHVQEAVEETLKLHPSVYEHPGGNGHSKSNTLWYITTRPAVPSNDHSFKEDFEIIIPKEDPLFESGSNDSENIFNERATEISISDDIGTGNVIRLTCFIPTKCSNRVLDTMAEGHSCRDRIKYLMDTLGKPEIDACWQVAVDEYPEECGACRP